ncbi:MAG: inositol monophosphatase family protein [bacterium]|nr:inositol monophosphatase family protein [bacterium]MDI1337662.1 inositol monophosphatase family protein [Lacunisphaera sp.]
MKLSEIEQRIAAAKQAVMAETALLHAEFGRAKTEIKHDGTKVTAVDIAISEHIQAAILKAFPSDQFFSEELAPTAAPVPVTSRFCWVLDPIDGTNNYANGIIYCAISLALLENGVPIYGVIYDMARRVLIHGGPGRGVMDGERSARAATEAPNGHSLIGFHSPVDKSYAGEGKQLIENFKIRGLGSSTLHLAYAAIGLLDGVVDHNNKVWDIAAACALLAEAGVEIHYLENPPFPMREFTLKAKRVQYVAGNPAMVLRLRAVLGR